MSAFERLHYDVQRWIFDQGWGSLRQVQVEAIERFFTTQDDLIISAPTASGKTEAAFLPVLTQIATQASGSVQVVYVGPLKALINDQFRRCELLCEAASIPVHRWHGDVGQADRKRLMEEPAGVLLITPESIESLLINRSGAVRRLFSGLEAVVIDELHVFPGSDRGLHLRSLLHRLDLLAGRRVRRLGLSATLGDPQLVASWLNPEHPDQVHVIVDGQVPREIRARIHAYVNPLEGEIRGSFGHDEASVETYPATEATSDQSEAEAKEMGMNMPLQTDSGMPTILRQTADLWRHHPAGINLVFGNRKTDLERQAVWLRHLIAQERIPTDRILIHHGSLSRDHREDTERTLHQGGHRICLCTATLELGIDIGSVRAVGHLGPPWSVASMAQRLGRSGRRPGEIPTIRTYVEVEDPDDTEAIAEDPISALEIDLVQALAILSLHLDHWCEPTNTSIRDLTVRIQQILSVIAQFNGIRADRLYAVVAAAGGLGAMPADQFKQLLRHLASKEVIEQIGNGDLLLGPVGQEIANDRGFYAVFMGGDEYRIVHDDRLIGQLPATIMVTPGDSLTLGGRSWRVVEIDQGRSSVFVVPGRGLKPLTTGGEGFGLHERVANRIREILGGTEVFDALLDPAAQRALISARAAYHHLNLAQNAVTAGQSTLLWTWGSGRMNLALAELLKASGTSAETTPVGVSLTGVNSFEKALAMAKGISDQQLVASLEDQSLPLAGKYDHLAPFELLATQHIERDIDLAAARRFLGTLV